MSIRLNIVFALLFGVNIGFGQVEEWDSVSASETVKLACENGYISTLGGIGNIEPLIFEADIIPYYLLGLKRASRWGVLLSPQVVLRMYSKESFPVQTPSYKPRVTFLGQIVNKKKKKDWFYYASWFHHSNGQDGSFFLDDSITVNTQNGSFSTNWVELGFFYSREKLRGRHFLDFTARYNYEQDKELDGVYGRLRFWGEMQSEWNLSRVFKILHRPYFMQNSIVVSQVLKVGYIADALKDAGFLDLKRLIVSYTLTYKPSFFKDVNLFAQYYWGQDYYNIYFNRQLKVLRFGIAAKAGRFY